MMEKVQPTVVVAPVPEGEVQQGKIRFQVVSIEQASVSQLFVDRLRAIGADSEAVDFAQRQVSSAGRRESSAPDANP